MNLHFSLSLHDFRPTSLNKLLITLIMKDIFFIFSLLLYPSKLVKIILMVFYWLLNLYSYGFILSPLPLGSWDSKTFMHKNSNNSLFVNLYFSFSFHDPRPTSLKKLLRSLIMKELFFLFLLFYPQ